MAEPNGRAGARPAPRGGRPEEPDADAAGRARGRNHWKGRARERACRGAEGAAGAARARGVHVPAGSCRESAEGARGAEPADKRTKGRALREDTCTKQLHKKLLALSFVSN